MRAPYQPPKITPLAEWRETQNLKWEEYQKTELEKLEAKIPELTQELKDYANEMGWFIEISASGRPAVKVKGVEGVKAHTIAIFNRTLGSNPVEELVINLVSAKHYVSQVCFSKRRGTYAY